MFCDTVVDAIFLETFLSKLHVQNYFLNYKQMELVLIMESGFKGREAKEF